MSEITVHFLGLIHFLTGQAETKTDISTGITLVKLLEGLARSYPELGNYMGDLDCRQLFNNKVSVLVNGYLTCDRGRVLSPGDKVVLIVPLCGG